MKQLIKQTLKRARKLDFVILVLLIGSLILNVYLGWNNKRLQATLAAMRTVRLTPGMKLEPITVTDLNGVQQTISYADSHKPTVFYVLSPKCGWCERNTQNINTLVNLKSADFRFVGLSLDEDNLNQYLTDHHFGFPVYKRPTPDSVHALGLRSTPQMIVISSEGVVLRNWVGVFADRSQREVETYFGVQLPGLSAQAN
jgi:thioredoxin-related protein